jgi:hypothetical protein
MTEIAEARRRDVNSDVARADTFNRFEHWSATPVQLVLLLVGCECLACHSNTSDQATIYLHARRDRRKTRFHVERQS